MEGEPSGMEETQAAVNTTATATRAATDPTRTEVLFARRARPAKYIV